MSGLPLGHLHYGVQSGSWPISWIPDPGAGLPPDRGVADHAGTAGGGECCASCSSSAPRPTGTGWGDTAITASRPRSLRPGLRPPRVAPRNEESRRSVDWWVAAQVITGQARLVPIETSDKWNS
mmetsp:Transcript_67284/g.154169  ORF Transcript_67284/g.154169 Transcript_67284/m.154169 type:complete len:124 (+) Transcript_67284:82-453(+)